MDALKKWQQNGGSPPWGDICSEDVDLALFEAVRDFQRRLPSRGDLFSWSEFEALDASWMNFDALHRLAVAGEMLGLSGFAPVKKRAEAEYERINSRASQSRVLASKMKRLIQFGSLMAWQRKAVETSSWGSLAYVRRDVRRRAANRQVQLGQLERTCESNILQSILSSPIWTRDRSHLKGLPQWLLESGKARARERGWSGWVFLAHYREYRVFMATAQSREMRRLMYNARSRAGSEFVPGCDNAMLAKKILSLRKGEAKEAGHPNYANYLLASRMLESPQDVEQMLLSVARDATFSAATERVELDEWMKRTQGVSRLEPWDYRFARAGLLKEASNNSLAASEKFFSPIGTIERSVKAVADFLGVRVARDRAQEAADLMVFQVFSTGACVGALTVVPSLRDTGDDKVAFEWMLRVRARNSKALSSSMIFLQLSSAGSRLLNLTHSDVVNLFHELGHAFHSLLGCGRHSGDGPAAIEADAFEFHSQLVEQLAWEPKIIKGVSRFKGRPMSMKMAEDLCALRNFHAGAWTISQVTDALCDLRLHTEFKPKGRLLPWEVMVAIKSEVGLDRPKSYNRQAQQLGTFTGSYVCSDYCYLWSEGLARRVFEWHKNKCSGPKKTAMAAKSLRGAFFEKGCRSSMVSQIRSYLGESPNATWVATSRGFI